MLAGIDAWEDIFDNKVPPDGWKIFEPRLQAVLNKEFFLEPPDFREHAFDESLKYKFLPYVRFPSWHYCSQCGFMHKASLFETDTPRCNPKKLNDGKLLNENSFKSCSKNKEIWQKKFLVPVRFMVICENGHIDDFPFAEWVHRKNKYDPNRCELRFTDGRGGNNSLLNVRVDCVSCNEGYSLSEAMANLNSYLDKDKNETNGVNNKKFKCTGNRPWLGPNQNEKGCNKPLNLVLRQASNVYYPVVKSSIYIPIQTGKIDRKIKEFLNRPEKWSLIKEHLDNIHDLKLVLKSPVKAENLDLEKVLEAIDLRVKGIEDQKKVTSSDDEEYRFQEYQFLKNKDPNDENDPELKMRKVPMNEYKKFNKYFENIFLINSLIETRVQTGFTRLLPYDPSKSSSIQSISSGNLNWLPGIIVKGREFFEFNEKKLKEWSSNFSQNHLIEINDRYNKNRKERNLPERKLNTKFFLIHTFAHLMINQLSYSCGYGSASLKERIYCDLEYSDKPMNGVLIYTASGDSEGSLGGLVREGEPENLEKIIEQSLIKAQVCSYDPVCLDNKSQGLNGTNSSSCHACSFLPETSCEEANQLLDRTTIVGDKEKNLVGYFEDMLQ